MTSPTGTAKSILREQIRARFKSIPAAERAVTSPQLCARILASLVWQSARTVLLFFPLTSEPDVAPLLAAALADGKLLALPRFNAAAQRYEAVQVCELTRELVVGPFQVREPAAICPVVPLNRLDLALVPGLGFDARGHRLGRGKGHYDRLLAGFGGRKIGVAFDFQIMAEVPCEAHDIVLDDIVTPARWIAAKAH
jgi:5-formyltetrahydrofolate cyclo-ligase